jgi:hypothetical protein
MIRTQVYLTEEQAQTIKLRSKQEQKPEAQVIRELVDRGLTVHAPGAKRKSTGEALLELAELGERLGLTGPIDLSTNHDDYLYGDKQ